MHEEGSWPPVSTRTAQAGGLWVSDNRERCTLRTLWGNEIKGWRQSQGEGAVSSGGSKLVSQLGSGRNGHSLEPFPIPRNPTTSVSISLEAGGRLKEPWHKLKGSRRAQAEASLVKKHLFSCIYFFLIVIYFFPNNILLF